MSYIDAMVGSVPEDKREEYMEACEAMSKILRKHGALRTVDCWGDDVPEGKNTDMYRAVQAKEGEVVVFSWMEWPSKEVRDAGMDAAMKDMSAEAAPPVNGPLMIFGGFLPLVEHK